MPPKVFANSPHSGYISSARLNSIVTEHPLGSTLCKALRYNVKQDMAPAFRGA